MTVNGRSSTPIYQGLKRLGGAIKQYRIIMLIGQHIPNFVDGVEGEVANFLTLDELVNIEFVKKWSEDENFYRYSISENTLMVEIDHGKSWWVIGYIKGNFPSLGLPKWKPVY